MKSVAEPSTICTSSSPFGWRSHAPSPENLALKMLPSRYGASVAKPPLPFRSPSVICGVRPRSSFSLANSALRSRMVIILPSRARASTSFVPRDPGCSVREPRVSLQSHVMNVPHIVVVGGGFGGLNAARALAGQPVRVTLLDRRNHHLFQPLLYQVATAALNASDIAAPLRSVLRRAGNVTVLLAEVERVDLAARRLALPRGELRYARLHLSARARWRRARLRRAHSRGGRQSFLLRPRGLGSVRAWPQDARGRAGDSPPRAAPGRNGRAGGGTRPV